jgi:hypothetical protein
VKDEGHEHQGSAAIRDWIKETIRKYDFKVEPMACAEANGGTIVTVLVSGHFPGSPVTLSYRFRLDDHTITRLEIG